MNTFWKKAGWALMIILPMVVRVVIQVIVVVVAGISMFFMLIDHEGLSRANLLDTIHSIYFSNIGKTLFVSHMISLLVFGLWYYFANRKKEKLHLSEIFPGYRLVVVPLMGIGGCLFSEGIVLLSQFVVPKAMEEYQFLMKYGLGSDIWSLLAVVLIAPMGEEIVCRGLIYFYAEKVVKDMSNEKLAFYIANFIQALIFGVLHFNLIQGSYAFVIGLFLGFMRKKSDSILPGIIIHAVTNASFVFILSSMLKWAPNHTISGVYLVILGAVAAGGGVIIEKMVSSRSESN